MINTVAKNIVADKIDTLLNVFAMVSVNEEMKIGNKMLEKVKTSAVRV
jgi:hypothetical protein